MDNTTKRLTYEPVGMLETSPFTIIANLAGHQYGFDLQSKLMIQAEHAAIEWRMEVGRG
jgi:hypothetical protein